MHHVWGSKLNIEKFIEGVIRVITLSTATSLMAPMNVTFFVAFISGDGLAQVFYKTAGQTNSPDVQLKVI